MHDSTLNVQIPTKAVTINLLSIQGVHGRAAPPGLQQQAIGLEGEVLQLHRRLQR